MRITAPYIADKCWKGITKEKWFPFKKGNLRYNGTGMRILNDNVATIVFFGSKIKYMSALENGSKAHNIPNAFGKGNTFGTYGRYDSGRNRHQFMDKNLYFHPGSLKHIGFISNKSVRYCVEYICKRFNGRVEK